MLGHIHALVLFLVRGPEADGRVHHLEDDEGHDEAEGPGGDHGHELHPELVGVARDQPLGPDRCQHAGCQRAEGAAHAVDADHVQGVVIAEPVLEHDAAVADRARAQADGDGPHLSLIHI
eukprot:TRINITY_DN8114_c0_g2_i1.p5 TRINITY_DN8114_c0_g2~~TRINITY_DN8114_c0_g2_i1.p5  ORF type:complete len:120 (+),score=63.08 TRINITY_DN8114_c0_g2_i1:415-774(+)